MLTSLGILAVSMATHVSAGETLKFSSGKAKVQLVELYTSQGCSSCPPADQWVNQFVDDPRLWKSVIPVAFHVDYWDYLGWKDSYASSDFSDRQRRYRRQGNVRSVYTPGFVVSGQEWKGWFGRESLPDQSSIAGELAVQLEGTDLSASYPANGKSLLLNVAVLGLGIETPIAAGENRGSKLRHDFVVLAHDQHASAKGHWQVRLPDIQPLDSKRFALAVWVSKIDRQAPLQATGAWLPEDSIRRQ